MQELFIDQPAQLAEFVSTIKTSPWLALDTEFIREKTYFPQLCLLQVCDGRVAACIDPLSIPDLGPLLKVLFDPSVTKIFHASRQDLEIFFNEWKRLPSPLFDTQPAAALLGYGEQIGYAGLIQKTLQIELPKDHSRTDWSRRPLGPGQLRYAFDDVIYLGQAYLKMFDQLQKLDRLSWLDNDFSKLVDPATFTADPTDMWKKVKGRQHLRGSKLAILQRLAAWREEQAVKRDLPRRWVLKDEIMIDLAKRQPASLDQMLSIRGLESGMIRRHGESWLQLLESARKSPKAQWPTDNQRQPSLTPGQEAMSDLLHCTLHLLAADKNMSPAAIASKKQLQALARGERDLPVMQGWRREIAGETLLALLNGKCQIIVKNSVPTLTQAD